MFSYGFISFRKVFEKKVFNGFHEKQSWKGFLYHFSSVYGGTGLHSFLWGKKGMSKVTIYLTARCWTIKSPVHMRWSSSPKQKNVLTAI